MVLIGAVIAGTAGLCQARSENRDALRFVIDHLDVTSFPSSIGPRRSAGKITFADYGFLPTQVKEDSAVLQTREHDWMIEIRLLRHTQEAITICLHDLAMNGGTYDAQELLELRPDSSGDRLIAEHIKSSEPNCPAFAR